jgi:WD40 repeat protein
VKQWRIDGNTQEAEAGPDFSTVADASPLASFDALHEYSINALALSEDETRFATGGRDAAVCLWDVSRPGAPALSAGKTPRNLATDMVWLPGSGGCFAQASEDLTVRVWDARLPLKNPVQTLTGFTYFALALAASPDGHTLLSSSKGFNGEGCEGRVWDLRLSKQRLLLKGHKQDAAGCTFVADGTGGLLAATGSKDGTVRLWDLDSGACVATASGCGMVTAISAVHAIDGGSNGTAGGSLPASICAASHTGELHVYRYVCGADGGELRLVASSRPQ